MNSIMISSIDEGSFQWIKNEAERLDTNIESVVARILNEAIERERKKSKLPCFSDLDALAGTWSDEDYDEFMSNISEFGKTDEELWR